MRPSKSQYMLHIARAAMERADCTGRRVGAVVHKDWRVLGTGYNGTPVGMANCTDGGCDRCNPSTRVAGEGYEACLCVHAEQNAIFTAARYGLALEGAQIHSTLQPCLTCLKACLQAGIVGVFYEDSWDVPDTLEDAYGQLAAQFDVFWKVTPEGPE